MAEKEVHRLRFWFRQEYKLAPTDPRYLAMSDDEILLEYEMSLVVAGNKKKTCPRCGVQTYRNECPTCESDGKPLPLMGDPELDQLLSRIEDGEDIDLTEMFGKGDFEPVPRG